MKPEEMTIGTEFGVIKITLCAKDLADMSMLREMMFNWYEDIAEREASLGRAVSTRHTSDQKIPCEHFDVDVEKIIDHINEIRDSARGYKTRNTRCGWVTEVPWEFENFQTLLNVIIEALTALYPF